MHNIHEAVYRLTADPFRMSPDHRFSYSHRSYARAKGYLDYALIQGEGFIMITGEPGTGKTTLINEILAGIDKAQMQVATLTSTQVQTRDLLQMVASSFELHFEGTDKASLLTALEKFLRKLHQDRRRAVLIVDEAQGLSTSALEELRLLANLQHNNQMLLQVFLVGQQQLRGLVNKPHMEQLRQRIIASSHLEPLNLDDTVNYVEHRLTQAGWEGDPEISGKVLQLVYQYSGGVPRRINLICTRLLLAGAMADKHVFEEQDARNVLLELQQEMLIDQEGSGQQEIPDGTEIESLPRASAHSSSGEQPDAADLAGPAEEDSSQPVPAAAQAAEAAVREAAVTPPEIPEAPAEPRQQQRPMVASPTRHFREPQVTDPPPPPHRDTGTGFEMSAPPPVSEPEPSAQPDSDERNRSTDQGISDRDRTRVKIARAVTRKPRNTRRQATKRAVTVSPDDFVARLPQPDNRIPVTDTGGPNRTVWGILFVMVVLGTAIGMTVQDRVITISVQTDRQGAIHKVKAELRSRDGNARNSGSEAKLEYQ